MCFSQEPAFLRLPALMTICLMCWRCRLMDIARRGLLNLRSLNDALLVSVFLPRCLPPAWKDQAEVEWTPGQNGHPTQEWLQLLWEKLQVGAAHLAISIEKNP